VEEGETLVAPIKRFGKPVGDILVRRPYTQLQSLLDATQPKGRRYYWKSEFLPGIEPALCEKAIERAHFRSPFSAIILFQIGGALNTLPQDHSPAGNRDAQYVLNVTSAWERADDDAVNIEWTREVWTDLRPFSTGGNYVNFQTADESGERLQAALGPAIARLTQIKTKWDPSNVFRTNKNIRPQAV
jgi:hypothetical protein